MNSIVVLGIIPIIGIIALFFFFLSLTQKYREKKKSVFQAIGIFLVIYVFSRFLAMFFAEIFILSDFWGIFIVFFMPFIISLLAVAWYYKAK